MTLAALEDQCAAFRGSIERNRTLPKYGFQVSLSSPKQNREGREASRPTSSLETVQPWIFLWRAISLTHPTLKIPNSPFGSTSSSTHTERFSSSNYGSSGYSTTVTRHTGFRVTSKANEEFTYTWVAADHPFGATEPVKQYTPNELLLRIETLLPDVIRQCQS